MKYYILFFLFFIQCTCFGQSTIEESQKQASDENKLILLVFTGSDWCKPCIQLKENILDTKEFNNFSNSKLVQLDLDFPYKVKLSKERLSHNEALAEKFNSSGEFPKMVLIDANMELIQIVGYNSGMNGEELIKEISKSL